MATLGALFDSAQTAGTDLYVVFSTPALQTALRKVHDAPLVFTVVADPFLVGAGKSDTEHLPHVTGVYTQGPYRELAELLHAHFPQIKRVGTLFCPAEVNSVSNKEMFVREAGRYGLTVETVPVNHPGELSDAALSLCSRQLDAVAQIMDNIAAPGFPTIAQHRCPGAVAGVHLHGRRRPARCRPGRGAGLLRRGTRNGAQGRAPVMRRRESGADTLLAADRVADIRKPEQRQEVPAEHFRGAVAGIALSDRRIRTLTPAHLWKSLARPLPNISRSS